HPQSHHTNSPRPSFQTPQCPPRGTVIWPVFTPAPPVVNVNDAAAGVTVMARGINRPRRSRTRDCRLDRGDSCRKNAPSSTRNCGCHRPCSQINGTLRRSYHWPEIGLGHLIRSHLTQTHFHVDLARDDMLFLEPLKNTFFISTSA
ncbi:unnamed protein product, partial [Protopolystoma xenopodis]